MPLNKYTCHIMYVCPTLLILYSTCRYYITVHISQSRTINCNFYLTSYIHTCAKNIPQMPFICHICQLLHMHIWYNYVSIYTSYELNAINNVNSSTGIHTLHIGGICPMNKYAYHIASVCPTDLLL